MHESPPPAERLRYADLSGLDSLDRRYLSMIATNYGGGPVGIETIAAATSEETDTIMDVYEPYLLQSGLIQRTNRGRVATRRAYDHLGVRQQRRAQCVQALRAKAVIVREEDQGATAHAELSTTVG